MINNSTTRADDMFARLGYTKHEEKNSILYTHKTGTNVRFYIRNKYYVVNARHGTLIDTSVYVYEELHDAITQKRIELGWTERAIHITRTEFDTLCQTDQNKLRNIKSKINRHNRKLMEVNDHD